MDWLLIFLISQTSTVLSSWLLFTYSHEETTRVRVFSIKIALAVLASGKLMDKLRFMFSQVTDSNGHLIPESQRCSFLLNPRG